MINEDDETAFSYLSNLVVVEYADVKSGYKITFVCQMLILRVFNFGKLGVGRDGGEKKGGKNISG